MSDFDPAGTTPGLAKVEEKEKVFDMKCRFPGCPSRTVTEVVGAPGTRNYRCTKCGYVESVAVGGYTGF